MGALLQKFSTSLAISKKVAPCVSSRTHPKKEKVEKIAVWDPERARRVSIQCRKKLQWSPKNGKMIWFRSTSTWNKKLVSRTHWRDTFKVSPNARNCVKRHHTHNSVFFYLFLLSLLQQVFNNIPANQIIISIYN